jgi:cellulose synthase/poly-beta-1,6-N-acetylglucosamine synthase-like glycosyltransferase
MSMLDRASTDEGSDGIAGKFYFRIVAVLMFAILTVSSVAFAVYLLATSNSVSMLMLAFVFLLLALVSGFFNTTSAVLYYRSYFYYRHIKGVEDSLKPLSSFPTVAVVVPVYNEDVGMAKRNVLRLKTMNYPKDKMRIYIADDSTDSDRVEELQDFSEQNGIVFMHRDNRTGFKAGAFNNLLKHSKEEYVAIFDVDEYLTDRNFLKDMIPYFTDKKVAYVQTRKRSFKGTFFSDSVMLFDDFFFTFIQPARAFNNTAIFAGSCGIIRRSALDKVGGFPEYVIEDTFLSYETDSNDYKGLYIPKIYAYGAPIMTFTALARQQWRYNYGDTQFLKYVIDKFLFKKVKLRSRISKVDYVTHGFGLNYLSVILVLTTIASVMIVFSNFAFEYMSIPQLLHASSMQQIVEMFGFAAFVLSLMVPVILTKVYFKSISRGIMLSVLNFALAIVRFKAALAAVLGINPAMHWYRGNGSSKHSISLSLFNTPTEIGFASVMFVSGYFALYFNNIAGSLWLAWYGIMYLTATMLIYKYG